jgi:hypothetical protein
MSQMFLMLRIFGRNCQNRWREFRDRRAMHKRGSRLDRLREIK